MNFIKALFKQIQSNIPYWLYKKRNFNVLTKNYNFEINVITLKFQRIKIG